MIEKKFKFICKICGKGFNKNFIKHIENVHNMDYEDYIVRFFFDGIKPTCACGCGAELKFNKKLPNGPWYSKHMTIKSHYYRLSTFNKKHTEKTKQKIKENTKKTIQKKYNVNNIMELQKFKDKIKQTKLEKYGDENFNNIEKNKKTKLEKYGDENFNNRNKSKITCNKKYGGNAPTCSSDILNIRKENNIKKYGVNNPMKTEKIKNKLKKINLEKYGTEFYFQSDEYKQKVFKVRYERLLNNKFIEPLFQLNEFTGIDKNYKFKCLKCNKIYESNLINQNRLPLCPDCFKIKKLKLGSSIIEKEIQFFINDNLNIKTKNNVKLFNNSKLELDIYIPDFNLAIELNGLYWHSEINGKKDKKYHLNKTKLCEEKEIKLLHIWDHEWINKQDIVKSIIKNNLNQYNFKIGARECIVKEIKNNKLKNIFLENNHIQGSDNSQIKLGLFYKNELVSLMTFGKARFNKKIEYEMFRFCNKLDFIILGGASKLFKYFIRNYNPKSIITYADKRYFTGKVYNKLNFNFLENTSPNYLYFKKGMIYSRYQFQKHKLKNKLKYFDKNLTEWENMQLNNYDRIWDCGNKKYIWGKK